MASHGGTAATPINNMYVGSVFWTFNYDIEKPDFIRSAFFQEPNFDNVLFCLQIGKCSETQIAIEFLRVLIKPDERPDDGFLLGVCVMLLGVRKNPDLQIMSCDSDYVSAIYEIADLKDAGILKNCWTVKCVIRMSEMTSLGNKLSEEHEELLKKITSGSNFDEYLEDQTDFMAFLLNRKSLSNVFTGRQGDEFAMNKCVYIERTLCFAEEIAEKFSARKWNIPYEQKSDMGVYLFYIYCKCNGRITVREAADLFVKAHYYGLEYLSSECREFMLNNMDKESIIDVLAVADRVIDLPLLCSALDIFVAKRNQIMATSRWINFTDSDTPVAQSIIDFSIRRVMFEGGQKETPAASAGKKSGTPAASAGKKSETPAASAGKKSETPAASAGKKSPKKASRRGKR